MNGRIFALLLGGQLGVELLDRTITLCLTWVAHPPQTHHMCLRMRSEGDGPDLFIGSSRKG